MSLFPTTPRLCSTPPSPPFPYHLLTPPPDSRLRLDSSSSKDSGASSPPTVLVAEPPARARINAMSLGLLPIYPNNRSYQITPIQQPERGAAFRATLSRLPLEPPLIIQLDCWDADGQQIIPYDELPFLVCHVTLQRPNGDDAQMVLTPEGEQLASLYGSLIASPLEANDRNGDPGVYFIFPDISVRLIGWFRIKAYMMRITGGPAIQSCYTENFEVVPEQQYVAPPVTALTQHFDAQGVARFGLARTEW